jgi:hypothetical protein
MCGAVVKPVITAGGLKLCPKCNYFIGCIEPKKIILSSKDSPKDTKGKYKPHLVLGTLTRAIARVREYGVKKYGGENGWKQQTSMDYMEAIGRHYDECRNDPRARDEESALAHIAQIATNAMFIIDMLTKEGYDFDSMKNPKE